MNKTDSNIRRRKLDKMKNTCLWRPPRTDWLWRPLGGAVGTINRRKLAPFDGEWSKRSPGVDCSVKSTEKCNGRLDWSHNGRLIHSWMEFQWGTRELSLFW